MLNFLKTWFPRNVVLRKTRPIRERCVLNYVHVRSSVLDAKHELVETVHPEANYLHAILLMRNLSIWPAEVVVRSTIQGANQISYMGKGTPREWEFRASLPPNRGAAEEYCLLSCARRESGREEFTTTFLSDAGYSDNLSIEVEIV